MKQAICTAAVLLTCLLQALCDGSQAQAAAASSTVQLSSPAAKVIKADGASSSYSGAYPKSFLDSVLIKVGDTLEASLTVQKDGASFQPQQVFLRLSSKQYGAAAFFVGKVKKNAYVASVTSANLEKQLGKVGGEFDVAWLIGDAQLSKGVQYNLGSVDIEQLKQLPKLPLTASSQPHEFLKKEIIHQHRAPEKRAPAGVSLLFTGLAVAPLAALLISVTSLKVNFKGFPSGTAGLAATAFHGGIAAMLGLYILFWLKLNIVETLPLAVLGGLFVAFTGFKALSAVADSRLKKD